MEIDFFYERGERALRGVLGAGRLHVGADVRQRVLEPWGGRKTSWRC